ncbi:MAG: T9SS type A sorting domain-containing protein [Chlorobi bacterium]|nr:T9SS type A sorting domain-containing protein [Chlorobiota bacterium]
MRKFTLIFTLLAFSSFVFAQNAAIQNALTKSGKTTVINQNSVKAGGDVLWSEDFDGGLDSTWSNVDLSDENMPWIWTTDSVFGAYTAGYINSETAANGFMAMDADGYNTVPQFDPDGALADPTISVDAYFETPPLTVCADQSGVIIEFHTQYRYFTGMRYDVEVSNDYVHWDTYMVNTTDISEINDPSIDMRKELNISATAAGQDTVYIRFHASASSHYYWCVDDIKLTVPFDNNMRLSNTWAFYSWEETAPDVSAHSSGYLQHGGSYYMIPKDHVDAYVGFEGAVQNFGMIDQTGVKMTTEIKYSAEDDSIKPVVYTAETEAKDISAAAIDTLYGAADYTPAEWGYYEIDMNVSTDAVEGTPDDNTDHLEFIVNDSVYSRTTNVLTSTAATRNWVGGGVDGDGLGVMYTLTQNTEVEGINWYFSQRNTNNYADLIEAGGFTYIARLFAYDFEADDWQTSPIISAPLGINTMADTGVWISSLFEKDGSSEFLQAGDYMAFIECNTSVGTGTSGDEGIGYYLGEDISIPQPDAIAFLWNAGSWGWVTANPMIRLVVDATENWTGNDPLISVQETKVDPFMNSVGQNFPNPASTTTTIKYRIDRTSDVTLSVYDVTGKRVVMVDEGNVSSGRHEVTIDVSELNAGIYYYTLNADHFESTKKMVVIE